MRLYHYPMSANARRVVMTAVHLQVVVELVEVDLAKGEQRAPAFLNMNPNGKVPVLEDDGFVLTESYAIMQYLADRTPGQTIYPLDIRARADVNRWLFWSAQHFTPAIGILNWENWVKSLVGAGPPAPAEVARGEELVRQCATLLDAHLVDRKWLAGQQLTLADLALAAPLMTIERAKLPVTQHAHLLGWFDRVQALDAWQRTAT
jgi:glutathione S-transferase